MRSPNRCRWGDPDDATAIGPVASRAQFEKVQRLIQQGIDEGATVVAGGPGRPAGLDQGYYVKPTVFADVTNDMTIASPARRSSARCCASWATTTSTTPST